MTAPKALVEALAYLDGVGTTDPERAAELIAEQLARRGYAVQLIPAPVLTDMTPNSLRRVRKALRLTTSDVAAVAGIAVDTYINLESGKREPRAATRVAVRSALVWLGARLPTGDGGAAD